MNASKAAELTSLPGTQAGTDPAAAMTLVAFGEALVDQFEDREVPGGAPFNVACHLAAFGAHPVLVTRTGKDAQGERLLHAMSAHGLDLRGVQCDPVRPTGLVEVHETASGHRFEIHSDQAYDHIHARMARLVGLSVRPSIVYFGTLAQRGDSRRALRALLEATDARTFLDLNLRDPWVDARTLRESLWQARVTKLNEDELARVADLLMLDGGSLRARAAVLLSAFNLERLIVTAGAQGAWTLDAAGRFETVEGHPLEHPVDTVGAGDGFAAVCLLGMLRGWPPALQLARADTFARAICGIRGAVPDAAAFYAPFLRDWQLDAEAPRGG